MQGIVFPALQDLESPKGDTNPKVTNFHPVSQSTVDLVKPAVTNSALASSACDSSSLDSKGDSCDNCEQNRCETHPKISYSVSYFNWSVSDQSSEDECENITVRLDRIKIRRSSRERNENLKEKDSTSLR